MFNLKQTNMNVKSLMLLLALAGLGASCSDDEAAGGGTTGIPGRSELQIVVSGSGESQSYEKTKAIATSKETQIDELQIYLFAAAAEGGPYYYLETWQEGTAYDPTDPTATNFKMTDAGNGHKASLYPNELPGVPYIKLFCVANKGVAGVLASDGATASKTTDNKFYQEDGTTEILAALLPVTTADNGDGTYNITPGTTEADFIAAFTKELGAAADGVISTPLLMTGQGKTKISGNVSVVNIDLTRVAARFDIDNTTSKSNLTIEKVTLAQGRKTAPLWDQAIISPVDKADLTTSPLIAQKYETVDFEKLPGANQGITESSLYVYPTLATDESYLILEGTYKSPVNSQQVPVTYHVPIVRTPEGAPEGTPGTPIAIKANNRYCLRITDVTLSNVFGTFDVVDWTSAGGITIRPDNDAPVFDAAVAFDPNSANMPVDLNAANPEATTYDYEVAGDPSGAGSFSLTMAATGAVRCEKETMSATKAGETDWLTITTNETEERDGVWYTTFFFSYSNSIGQQPVAVHFINETASYDPALWTTVNFYGPKAVPSFAPAAAGNSKGNLANADDPKAPTATIYSVNGSYVTFDITSIEGVEADALTGYTAEKIASNGFVHTFKVSVTDQANANGGALVFKNAGDPTKTTTLTITKADPGLKFTEITDADNVGDWVEGVETPYPTTGTLKIDLDALTSYTFRIEAPENLTVNGLTSDWLTISESHSWSESERYIEYTLSKKGETPAGTGDFHLTFTNGLTEASKGINAPGMDITVHKDYSKPKYTAAATGNWSPYNADFAVDASFADPTAATISMYKFNTSKISVMMNCSEAASFENVNGLKVDQVGSTNEYTIEVTDAAQFTNATTDLIAHNDGAYSDTPSTDRKAKLTITWVSPEITVEALATGAMTPTVTGLNVTVPSDFKRYTDASFKIVGHKGSTITYPDVTGKWTGFDVSPASISAAGSATVTLLGTADVSDTSTISITVHNAVKDEDVTININKDVAP